MQRNCHYAMFHYAMFHYLKDAKGDTDPSQHVCGLLQSISHLINTTLEWSNQVVVAAARGEHTYYSNLQCPRHWH